MSTGRFVAPGRTRSCPHCKATILDSATVCPGCHHHLRFDSTSSQRAQTSDTPLRVDGILRHTADGGAWEYSIVLAIRNGRGEEISRQVVGVGALQPAEERTFSLAVEVFKPAELSKPVEVSKPAEAPKPVQAPKPLAAAANAAPSAAAPAAPARPATPAAPTVPAVAAVSSAAGGATPARAPVMPSRPAAPPAAAASSASTARSPDPRAVPGRIVPPGVGREPIRPQPNPARGVGLKDPRFGVSDPLHPKR